MSFPILILVLSFTILVVLNVPIAFCMGISTVLALLAMGDLPAFVATAHKIATGIDSFTLLAIPFFILSGLLMGHGGIARRLIDFANVVVGRFRGGLAFVNILTCMLFGAISGSATAAVSAIGGFMIPLMNKMGYNREFNTSVTVTAATTGLLIPPSNSMIVYSLATGGIVSIAALFMAGYVPGILTGISLMIVSGIISIRKNYGKGETFAFKEGLMRFLQAIPPMMLVIHCGRRHPYGMVHSDRSLGNRRSLHVSSRCFYISGSQNQGPAGDFASVRRYHFGCFSAYRDKYGNVVGNGGRKCSSEYKRKPDESYGQQICHFADN